ncbi:MAG: T9SS type A sorting domain-containing protein [Candidatus Marinimicrobia bacterium]|jgi:hypothetical protein|nr:T9SS type A sorting domain-containing protein [Candidatus Neomarinimicrobiota bacterium]MBT7684914.1 T9SS type A sorting domain-containing protein [Candidatus Neomarinimicrobiota bacterium]
MNNIIVKLLTIILLIGITLSSSYAQVSYECYTVPDEGNTTILIENGNLYRLTIRSCWMSAYARMGTYLIYGLNISDATTNGEPAVLPVAETESIDWTFSYNLSGSYNANMTISSSGWGDQGLMVGVETLSCSNPSQIIGSNSPIESYELSQNYPNPFNPSTTIDYTVQNLSNVKIKIFDSSGHIVKILVNETKMPGQHSAIWNGRTDNNMIAPSGTYFYQIHTKDYISAKKMILLK